MDRPLNLIGLTMDETTAQDHGQVKQRGSSSAVVVVMEMIIAQCCVAHWKVRWTAARVASSSRGEIVRVIKVICIFMNVVGLGKLQHRAVKVGGDSRSGSAVSCKKET